MNFLAKHFEKLILAVCLLCLIWSIKSVSDHGNAEVDLTAQASTEMSDPRKVSKGQKMVELLDESTLVEFKDMQDPPGLALNLQTNGNPASSGLFEGGKYVICKNPKCGYVLPFNVDVCPNPECRTEQDAIVEDPPPSHDLDHDGIPDVFEKQPMTGLDYRYPYDSMEDFDRDGFLNIEEYRAGTDLMDPQSRPPLAFLLRRDGKAQQSGIPITLMRVKTFEDPNPNAWKASVSIDKSTRPKDFRAGDKIDNTGYTLVSISSTDNSIVIRDAGGTEYTLHKNQDTQENSFSIDFVYLNSHTPGRRPTLLDVEQMSKPRITEEEYAKKLEQRAREKFRSGGDNRMMNGPQMGPEMMPGGPGGNMRGGNMPNGSGMDGNFPNNNENPLRFRLHVGDMFVLQKAFTIPNGDEGLGNADSEEFLVTEYYRVLDVQVVAPAEESDEDAEGNDGKAKESRDIVLVQQLSDEAGSPVGDPIEVPMLDKLPTWPRLQQVSKDDPGEREPAPASNDYFINVGNQMGRF